MINVRRATIEDIPMIMQFLDEHWLKGYALAHNRELFEWQFVRGEKVNIWIGIDEEADKMYAMQGVVVYSNDEKPDISGMLWIALKSEDPLLAFEVQDFFNRDFKDSTIYTIGLRSDAVKINRKLGNDVTYMRHYYRLSDIDGYHIAIIKNKVIPSISDSGYRLYPVTTIEEIKRYIPLNTLKSVSPHKDYEYLEWRYLNHPVFKYDLWSMGTQIDNSTGLLVTRTETYKNYRSCKIVDYYGDDYLFSQIGTAIDQLLQQEKYEYIDVYSFGMDENAYKKAGFVECDSYSENIIPNNFQPYVPENSEIAIINPASQNVRFFRGDSDQDKPRLYM